MEVPADINRRVVAAAAYSPLTDDKIAAAARIGLRTLGHWKKNGIPNDTDPRKVRRLADACGLPVAFFYVDWNSLPPFTEPDEGQRPAPRAPYPPSRGGGGRKPGTQAS